MILTRDEILAEIDAGRVVVDSFDRGPVAPASIDLHLDDEIRLLEGGPEVIDVDDDADYLAVSRTERPCPRKTRAATSQPSSAKTRISRA